MPELLALLHVEVESGEAAAPLRPRMFEYYVKLRQDTQLPVLPIGLFLRVGLDGLGWDAYEEHFWEHRLLRFEYAYVGLPGLKAEDYLTSEHLLGAALSVMMRVPAARRAEMHLQALKQIALSSENDWRRFLLAECVEAYGTLDETQTQQLQALLNTKEYQEVRPLMITTYERGKAQGKAEGLMEGKLEGKVAGWREIALLQLEAKFGTLSTQAIERINSLSTEQLRTLLIDLAKARSLQELNLTDGI
jgi:hypothetical protein